jgi:prophage DNA circulation protein
MTIYFIGDDFDKQLNDFEALMKERYTLDSPGILKHPMWGDINVFPVSWSESIELVDGVGIGNIEVEFVEVFLRKYPSSELSSSDAISGDLDDMSLIDSASEMATDTVAATTNIKSKIQAVVGAISDAVEFIETIEETMTSIQAEINSMIDDIAGNISQLLFAVQRLMRAPARLQAATMNKINTYSEMCSDIIEQITSGEESNITNKKNNAILLQSFAGYAVASLAESSIYTDYEIRTNTIDAINIIENSLEEYNTSLSAAWVEGSISEEYSGDHNFQLLLFDAIARIKDLLLNKTFDLKSQKTFILKNPSDPITLCYKYYSAVDNETVEYFLRTNDIKNDEFIEIPSGREIIIYV